MFYMCCSVYTKSIKRLIKSQRFIFLKLTRLKSVEKEEDEYKINVLNVLLDIYKEYQKNN